MTSDQAGARLAASPLRALALVLTLLPACYTYRPLPAVAPEPGRRVAVALTDGGSRTLAGQIGPGVNVLEGSVLRADSAALVIAVAAVENHRGERSRWDGEQVKVRREFVREVQERQLSVGGTGILGGAVAVGLYAAYELIGGQGSGAGRTGTGGGGDR